MSHQGLKGRRVTSLPFEIFAAKKQNKQTNCRGGKIRNVGNEARRCGAAVVFHAGSHAASPDHIWNN
ncbi:Uncharacterized protein APZ42_019547 [Daphnia magna]|uniref:Uncharacterized protein n=1 Tax=Daphnia magna TaxID=35525 RepID=A0A164Y974_9CRUS|nr:Uncharacterized protein APZ42_019547 [Daphnia magna]